MRAIVGESPSGCSRLRKQRAYTHLKVFPLVVLHDRRQLLVGAILGGAESQHGLVREVADIDHTVRVKSYTVGHAPSVNENLRADQAPAVRSSRGTCVEN